MAGLLVINLFATAFWICLPVVIAQTCRNYLSNSCRINIA